MIPTIRVRWLGRVDYEPTWRAMQALTDSRGPDTPDELWLLEHPPVYTLGMNADPLHVLAAGDIPVVRTERGGQVTYHGPGQIVAYLLLDLRRTGLGVRDLVCRLEAAVIAIAGELGVPAVRRPGAPGVYVADSAPRQPGAKFASIGLKVSRGCTFHGIALNADMDLTPFERINPCGYAGLPVTDLTRASGARIDLAAVAADVGARLTLAATAPPGTAPACAVEPSGALRPAD